MKNNNSITIILPGKPMAKQRVRRDRSGNWYNPQQNIMQNTAMIIRENSPKNFFLNKKIPITLSISCFFEPNKKEKTKKFIELIKNDDYPYIKKPDLDNIFKFYKDVMSKTIFNDDNQVFRYLNSGKYYSLNPRTEIEISWPNPPHWQN